MRQLDGAEPGRSGGPAVIVTPFMIHVASAPLSCCQTRSGRPSPLKSVTHTTFHAVSGTPFGVRDTPPTITDPFMRQAESCPVVSCLQNRSVFPSRS